MARKIHTRAKRRMKFVPKSNYRTFTRAKTFKTEEAAKKWAEEQGIKKYVLENSKSDEASVKKIRVKITE